VLPIGGAVSSTSSSESKRSLSYCGFVNPNRNPWRDLDSGDLVSGGNQASARAVRFFLAAVVDGLGRFRDLGAKAASGTVEGLEDGRGSAGEEEGSEEGPDRDVLAEAFLLGTRGGGVGAGSAGAGNSFCFPFLLRFPPSAKKSASRSGQATRSIAAGTQTRKGSSGFGIGFAGVVRSASALF